MNPDRNTCAYRSDPLEKLKIVKWIVDKTFHEVNEELHQKRQKLAVKNSIVSEIRNKKYRTGKSTLTWLLTPNDFKL